MKNRKSLLSVISAILVVLIITTMVCPGRVYHESMEPNFTNNDKVIINKVAYNHSQPKHNDIVLVWDPINEVVLIKRVIAVEGDNLRVTRNGKVYLNSELLEETYLNDQQWTSPFDIDMDIPKDSIFVMGDNREVSYDSRYELGYVNKSQLRGEVILNLTKLFK